MQRYFNNEWSTQYVDTDWETKFHWERKPLQPVSNTTTHNEEHNVLTNLFKMISNTLGIYLDVEKAMEMYDKQEIKLPGAFYRLLSDETDR